MCSRPPAAPWRSFGRTITRRHAVHAGAPELYLKGAPGGGARRSQIDRKSGMRLSPATILITCGVRPGYSTIEN